MFSERKNSLEGLPPSSTIGSEHQRLHHRQEVLARLHQRLRRTTISLLPEDWEQKRLTTLVTKQGKTGFLDALS